MQVILQQNFCRNLKAAMAAREVSQSEIARRMMVGRATVNDYVRGRTSPGLDMVEKFANALDVPGDWLISGISIEDRLNIPV